MTAFAYNAADGALTALQTVPTLPADFDGRSTIVSMCHRRGRYLYGSNRGHDSIVVYQIDRRDWSLDHCPACIDWGKNTPETSRLTRRAPICWLPTRTVTISSRSASIRAPAGINRDRGSGWPVSMPVCVLFVVH